MSLHLVYNDVGATISLSIYCAHTYKINPLDYFKYSGCRVNKPRKQFIYLDELYY